MGIPDTGIQAAAPRIVRGRLLRTLKIFLILYAISLAGFGTWIAHGNGPRAKKVKAIECLVAVQILLTAVALVLTAGSEASVHGTTLSFSLFGVRTRQIPLESIRGYWRMNKRSKGSPIRIDYGTSSWYCPNGLLDPKEVVELLHECGIREVESRPNS